MLKFEKKVVDFCEKHYILLGFIFITIMAFLVRYFMRQFTSGDFNVALHPWFVYLRENGSLKALANYPGDYNAPYMTIMALLTYLPLNDLFLIALQNMHQIQLP